VKSPSNLLVFGDQASATVMAVDKRSGRLVWKTLLDSHAGAIITSSPVEFGGKIYAGAGKRDAQKRVPLSCPKKRPAGFRRKEAYRSPNQAQYGWKVVVSA
jgi:hypothetical protein